MPPDSSALERLALSRSEHAADGTRDSTIIVFGLNPWNTYLQTRQHVARGLATRGWPVTYTSGLPTWWDRGGPKWHEAPWFSHAGESDGVILDHPGRWLTQLPRLPLWNRFISHRYIGNLARLAGWNKAAHRIAYVFHPQFEPCIERLKPTMVVYHADDSFSKMPEAGPDLAARERSLIDRADLIIATSPGVARCMPGTAPSRARVLQNGADAEFFMRESSGPCPPDLAKIPPPRIGYCGTINPKVDLSLVADLATARPAWSWVFVGKPIPGALSADPRSAAAKNVLDTLPNVHFLGERPYADLPRYQANMDINTMCYRTDPGGWWEDVSPLKLYEYLAVGQPVIGADLEVLRPLQDVLTIARSTQEWHDAIAGELEGRGKASRAMRRAAASGHGWDAIVAQIEAWIVEYRR